MREKNNSLPSKVKFKIHLGGLIPPEEIGEILTATQSARPELIDYFLYSWVKNPRRILRNYSGTFVRLPDYHVLPGVEFPLYVSRMNGAVLPESWGARRKRGVPLDANSSIFDVAAIIFGLQEKKDFPKVYRIVRKAYEAFKHLPGATEESNRENARSVVRRIKARCLPYFPSDRKTYSARQLWDALPVEVREEEFGGSFYRFKDDLEYFAREDPFEGPFRVERIANGKGSSRFRLLGKDGIHPSTIDSEDSLP